MIDSERRGKMRLRPKSLTFVAIRPEFARMGKLLDISKGGLCFQYMSEEDQKEEGTLLFKVDVFISQNGYYLPGVPCRVIYDTEIRKGMVFTIGLKLRRCGLKFEDLTEEQADQIELYLKNHAG